MSLLSNDFIASYGSKTPPWGFGGLGEVVFLRTYSRKIDGSEATESWTQTIKRIIDGAVEIGVPFSQEEAEKLFDHMFNLRCSVSGRALWQLGTPLVSKFSGTSLNNCFYTNIEKIEDFELLFDYLMLGGGVGFSVERAKIHELPKVKKVNYITAERTADADFIVPDSRQGWRELLHKVLESYFVTGKSFTYSTILIREYGAPLKTFGGIASGPGALVEGLVDIGKVLDNRVGKKLRSVDVLDICNIIGRIVISGSSRRSAQIAIGDPDDMLFLRAKNWGSGNVPAWRSNSNNSIYADAYDEIVPEFWKVEISRLLYMVQKQITRLSYPYEKTNTIVHKNGRLGQSVTGILQATEKQVSWLNEAYEYLKSFDKSYSDEHGWNPSIRLTTVQPSGTLSLLPGVTPGIHPAFAQYYTRRVRFSSVDPLVDACRKRGYKVVWDIGLDGREDHTRYVVEFPCKSPEGAVLAANMTAIDQLEWVKKMQTEWADNAVSVTVYYRKEELPLIKEWLSKNYDSSVKSVSFLLHVDHNFPLPPYEEITEDEYNKSIAKLDFSVPLQQNAVDLSIEMDDCATGACPIR